MQDQQTKPTAPRLIGGFLLAPLIGALAFACLQPSYGNLPLLERVLRTTLFVAAIAYLQTALFGLPAYIALRGRVLPFARNAMGVGALVATIPWFALLLLPQSGSQQSGTRVTMADGVRTIWGWIEVVQFYGTLAIIGAVAGLVFWVIVAQSGTSPRPRSLHGR